MDSESVAVLVIDDDPDEEILVRQRLRRGGGSFHVSWRGEYDEGLQALASSEFDVALLDYRLGERDGLSLLMEAKRRGCDIPLILVTGQGDIEIDQLAMKAGAADYLTKDESTPELLTRAIRYALEQRRIERSLVREASLNAATSDLSTTILSTDDSAEIARVVLDHALRFTDSSVGFVGALNPTTGDLVAPAYTPGVMPNDGAGDGPLVFHEPRGLWGWVWDNRESLLLNQAQEDHRAAPAPEGHEPIRRFVAAPAVAGDELVGIIALANPAADYGGHDLVCVERFASFYALAVQKSRHEEALQASRDQLRLTTDATPILIARIDSDRRYVFANSAYAGWVARDAEAIVGEAMADVLGPELYTVVEPRLDVALAGEIVQFEDDVPRPGGELRHLSGTYTPEKTSAGEVRAVIISVMDVTDRKTAEGQVATLDAELQERVRELQRVIEGAGCLLWRATVTDDERGLDWKMNAVAEDAAQQFLPLHVPPGSSYGSAWDEAKLPENRAQMDKTAEDAIRDGLPGYEQEFQCVDKDGRTRWLYEDARIEAQGPGKWSLTGVCIDVTDQRYANERLRKLSSVLDQIADTVVVTDTEGKIEYVNPAFEQATGYTQVEALGRTPAILKSGEHDAAFYEEMWATILRGDSFQAEFVNRTKAGAFFHTEKTITPIRDPSGQVSHFAATGRDVTERYEFERSLEDTNRKLQAALAEIRDTQEQALQQERLRALGQMASGIAHDFNNTLAPILGFADLLLARPATLQDEEKALRYLTTIRTAADDARNIVARMREFYRPRSDGDFLQKLDPQQIVGEAISLTQPRWKDEALARGTPIEVHTELEPVPTLLGDATELREALTNLIFNACDAMPDGGHLTIRTCTGPRDEVVLEVSDTGMGMSEEVRRRCIEPFYTTKETHGTGMGLAMVYGTMGRHAGSVEIESEEGKGSTFRLRFPRREEPTAERASSAAAEIAQPLSVLAVDDEPLVREVIAEYMRGDGHGVHVCTNGVEALDVATSETFDLIITDRAMPEMSGDQLATALREKGVETPIIMLTGFGAVMDDCPEHVDSVVSKPVTLDELRAAISAVV